MRTSNLILALPALAVAQQQIPLLDQVKGWFSKASASISSAMPAAASTFSVPNPIASGAAKLADLKVDRLTLDNHKTLLQPGAATASPGLEEWMIFVTGGNKTCYGMCNRAETAWNESVSLISVASKTPPHLAMLDCETDGVLCHAWATGPPSVLHMFLPQPQADQSAPMSIVRTISVNRTSITAPQLAEIHLMEKYKEQEPYTGIFHPFDGFLAKAGLSIPVGYAIWGFSQIPSWALMILISFASRSFMGRRMQPPAARGGAAAPAGQAPAAS